ncbi:SDR family NAD(P)-dependent oxidoreductase [Georgenia deserti]|uniref:SDR family NAD(P)-dependent oxidoreductase n=1 Tax=Georgenia deserti TaxID=2093781 RepID=A0ABW4L0G6_9MICO
MNTIVMTGGTSGLGAVAVRHISAAPQTRLLLGARNAPPDGVESVPLDLASLEAVRSFAATVIDRLDGAAIDTLVLNAGTLRPDADGRTTDGYETTFTVNHLAQYLLLRLLLDHLRRGAVVVATTSGTHDPTEGAGLPLPRHADPYLLAHPEHEPEQFRGAEPDGPAVAGRRAYTASKLCTVLTVRALKVLPQLRSRDLVGVAYCPGQTPGTGLAREMPRAMRTAWRVLGRPVGVLVPRLNTPAAAGRALADLALGDVRPPAEEYYAALRRGHLVWKAPSELARRDDVVRALWDGSAELAGLATAPGSADGTERSGQGTRPAGQDPSGSTTDRSPGRPTRRS